jgi:hypothetical protein
LLALGKPIGLCLTGKPFHYRQIFVDRVDWYTKGDPDPCPYRSPIRSGDSARP